LSPRALRRLIIAFFRYWRDHSTLVGTTRLAFVQFVIVHRRHPGRPFGGGAETMGRRFIVFPPAPVNGGVHRLWVAASPLASMG